MDMGSFCIGVVYGPLLECLHRILVLDSFGLPEILPFAHMGNLVPIFGLLCKYGAYVDLPHFGSSNFHQLPHTQLTPATNMRVPVPDTLGGVKTAVGLLQETASVRDCVLGVSG